LPSNLPGIFSRLIVKKILTLDELIVRPSALHRKAQVQPYGEPGPPLASRSPFANLVKWRVRQALFACKVPAEAVAEVQTKIQVLIF
jgi:hypothetical protein